MQRGPAIFCATRRASTVAALAAFCLPAANTQATAVEGVPIVVSIVAPDDYIRGGVLALFVNYDNGTRQHVDERVLESAESLVVKVPKEGLSSIRAELRHPKYRPAHDETDTDGLEAVALTLRPVRWTTDDRHTWIEPSHEAALAGQEHLRWIRNVYFERPERLLINETFQADRRLVSHIAFGGGGKQGDWEKTRQANIAEWKAIEKIMEERSHEPCPDGYVHDSYVDRSCGAVEYNIIYYSRDPAAEAARAAAEDEKWQQIRVAQADLAKRLQLNESEVRYGGYEQAAFGRIIAALDCTEVGAAHEQAEETLGYYMVFSVRSHGSYYYYGRGNEAPMYCTKK